MKKTPKATPPKLDWSKVTGCESRQFPIGPIVEYSFPKEMNMSSAIGQFNGPHPDDATWGRNTQVDAWYVMLKGTAVVTLENNMEYTLKEGDWIYFPKGTWYKAAFTNAVVEIPTIPQWSPGQYEKK